MLVTSSCDAMDIPDIQNPLLISSGAMQDISEMQGPPSIRFRNELYQQLYYINIILKKYTRLKIEKRGILKAL